MNEGRSILSDQTRAPAKGQGLALALRTVSGDFVHVLSSDGVLVSVGMGSVSDGPGGNAVDFIGQPWRVLWPDAQRRLVTRALDAAGRGETAEFEAICPTVTGQARVWAVRIIPVPDALGRIERLVASSRDVTGEAAHQQALRDKIRGQETRLAETEAALAEREHMISDMDHRVKNSLALVSTMLRLQKRTVEDKAAADMLEAASMRVMAVARVHEGLQKRSAERTVDVAPYLEAVLRDLDEAMGADLPTDLDLESGIFLPGSKTAHLGLIAVELVQNARKHGARAVVPVRVSLRRLSRSDRRAVLEVADGGPGLPDGFDVSRQGGLGLKICASGAAMLGGELETHGGERGAVFGVTFPLT